MKQQQQQQRPRRRRHEHFLPVLLSFFLLSLYLLGGKKAALPYLCIFVSTSYSTFVCTYLSIYPKKRRAKAEQNRAVSLSVRLSVCSDVTEAGWRERERAVLVNRKGVERKKERRKGEATHGWIGWFRLFPPLQRGEQEVRGTPRARCDLGLFGHV